MGENTWEGSDLIGLDVRYDTILLKDYDTLIFNSTLNITYVFRIKENDKLNSIRNLHNDTTAAVNLH